MKIVCIAGAGLSTASGIPDFKGKNGLYTQQYENMQPEEILHVHTLFKNPELFYRFFRDKMLLGEVKPNAAHLALKELEDMGVLTSVITQNIDGLEFEAGIKNARQIHGTIHHYYCVNCAETYTLGYIQNTTGVPRCHCGGLIRPDVVMYGEMLNEQFNYAKNDVAEADVLLIVGTSFSVYPAASLIDYFKGGRVLVFNQGETTIDNGSLVTKIDEPLEIALPNFVEGLKQAALEQFTKKQ